MITAEERAATRKRHTPCTRACRGGLLHCNVAAGDAWPCFTIRLLDELEEAEQVGKRREEWLTAEIAGHVRATEKFRNALEAAERELWSDGESALISDTMVDWAIALAAYYAREVAP
jgi:hypothetical protein